MAPLPSRIVLCLLVHAERLNDPCIAARPFLTATLCIESGLTSCDQVLLYTQVRLPEGWYDKH